MPWPITADQCHQRGAIRILKCRSRNFRRLILLTGEGHLIYEISNPFYDFDYRCLECLFTIFFLNYRYKACMVRPMFFYLETFYVGLGLYSYMDTVLGSIRDTSSLCSDVLFNKS